VKVEDALREGEAYLLANQLHLSREVSHQVEAELATAHSKAEATTHVAAATNQLSTASKVAQVTDIVAKLVAALTPVPVEELARRPLRSRARLPREQAITGWDCDSRGHFHRECPSTQKGLNYHGPQEPLSAAGRR